VGGEKSVSQESRRPSPEEVLERIQAEAASARKGKLKIFLGYAAGVGKTYSMLEAARQRLKDTDLVAGIVETHGRSETLALLGGLEVVPQRQVEYRGTTLSEMDIDAVLARHPQLALVDELAHENAPGSRNRKRYQDVQELLQAGIDVYTTLNIQHVESLRDTVAQITGIWMRESVPDSIIDEAAEVELVDLPPDELIKRLKDGKVYVPEQIGVAMERFFRKGNLLALRELAMRIAGRHADEQTLAYMKAHAIQGPWSSSERLLVCIAPDSSGSRLVRSARRLAHDLAAEWSAILIETPASARLSPDEQDRLARTLDLAQRLGATASTVRADSAFSGCLEFARNHNITKIIVGHPSRLHRHFLAARPLAEQLAHRSDNVDIVVVGGGEIARGGRDSLSFMEGTWQGYLFGIAAVSFTTLLALLLRNLFTPTNLVMPYLLCVGVTAVFGGFGPSMVVSILAVLVFDFFFVPPTMRFTVADTEYVLTFFVMLVVGLAISYLMRRIRLQAEAATRRERETSALYSLGRDLAVSNGIDSHAKAIVNRARETFDREAFVLLPANRQPQALRSYGSGDHLTLGINETAEALWCLNNQRPAGRGTDALPNAQFRYIPLATARGPVGVLALAARDASDRLTIRRQSLLDAFADLAAMALEGIQLDEQAHRAEMVSQVMKDTERLQTALLNSVSHDLRTPLVSIMGALSSLAERNIKLDEDSKAKMVKVALGEAERLNRLITNLLDVSRIEAGALRLIKQPCDVQEMIGAAIERLGTRHGTGQISARVNGNIPLLEIDLSLMVQALVNVLDNAVKYSPEDSTIDIVATRQANSVVIEVTDRGEGIPAPDLSHVFEKFYRVHRPERVTGTGLGLSITKGIVEAHGGRVSAENAAGGGTRIKIEIPVPAQQGEKSVV
jgi:two-component system sensor histidine kinase KdpD